MLCDKCKKREATHFYKQNINGKVEEYHLCGQCAEEMQVTTSFFKPFSFGLPAMLGSLFSDTVVPRKLGSQTVCPFCGKSFTDICESGETGCAQCYDTFYEELLPSLKRIHGNTRHVGKIPRSAGSHISKQRRLEELQKQLDTAVKEENYEKAIELRDAMKELEGKEEEK